jgi:hypothetical protein
VTAIATAEVKLTDKQQQVARILSKGPFTLQEISGHTGIGASTIRAIAEGGLPSRGIPVAYEKKGRSYVYWIEGAKPRSKPAQSGQRNKARTAAPRRRQPRPRKKMVIAGIPTISSELKITREGLHPDRKTKGYYIQLADVASGTEFTAKLESEIQNLANHTVIVLSHQVVGDSVMIEVMNDVDRIITISLPAPKPVPASRKARTLL